jgi:hypothetical protein
MSFESGRTTTRAWLGAALDDLPDAWRRFGRCARRRGRFRDDGRGGRQTVRQAFARTGRSRANSPAPAFASTDRTRRR